MSQLPAFFLQSRGGTEGQGKDGSGMLRKLLFWWGKLCFRHLWNNVLVPTRRNPFVQETLDEHSLPHVLKALKSYCPFLGKQISMSLISTRSQAIAKCHACLCVLHKSDAYEFWLLFDLRTQNVLVVGKRSRLKDGMRQGPLQEGRELSFSPHLCGALGLCNLRATSG